MKNELISLLEEQEQAQETAFELVDEIMIKAQDEIFKRHISRQTIPAAISWAETRLLEAINVYFMEYDKVGLNVEWKLDVEPEPVEADSWACGFLTLPPKSSETSNEQKFEPPAWVTQSIFPPSSNDDSQVAIPRPPSSKKSPIKFTRKVASQINRN